MQFLVSLALAAVPIFVAIDILGVLPLYFGFMENVPGESRRGLVRQAILTAAALSLGFLFLARQVFNFLEITAADFQVGGGLVLLSLSILDIVQPGKGRRRPGTAVAVVPIGTPLIAGPALLTTLLVLVDEHGFAATLWALVLNLLFAWLVLSASEWFRRVLGDAWSRAISKIASLLLAAIAIRMIRLGLSSFLGQ
ncbi:MAG: MarC family protein [Candidatus Tectomicrobia bacterium]|nr:MarC family protein [Candidatus Tectomicrobia bacterium]